MDLIRWWDTNWGNRVLLATESTGDAYTSGVHYFRTELNFDVMPFSGLVNDDLSDIRIVYQTNDNIINIPHYIASGTKPVKVYFAAQHNIPEGQDYLEQDAGLYYCYYNAQNSSLFIPDPYININFPKAPYSVHPSGYNTPYGRYVDKHLFRLNNTHIYNGGESGVYDATGHSSGIATLSNPIIKAASGILDRAIYFPYGSYFEIPTDGIHRWDNPSGEWCVDVWVNILDASLYHKYFHLISKEDDNLPDFIMHCENDYGKWRNTAKYPQSTANYFNQVDDTNNYLDVSTWHHVRAAYRTGGDYEKSRIYLYVDGYEKNPSTALGDMGNVATIKFSKQPIHVGRNFGHDNYQGTALLEQWRYSTFVYPAMSGSDDYGCAPDWVDNQYVLTTFTAEGEQAPNYDIGAIVSTRAPASISGEIGGAIETLAGENRIPFGGLLATISPINEDEIGGFSFVAEEASGQIGGFLIVSHSSFVDTYVESLNRTLIKANSDDVKNQECGFNANYWLMLQKNQKFDSEVTVQRGNNSNYDAELTVEKRHLNPYFEIIDTQFESGAFYITASGHAYDRNNNPIESGINHVSFIWGNGNYTNIENSVASGSIWKSQHEYSQSGLYRPIVRGMDRYGNVGSADCIFNFVPSGFLPSGLEEYQETGIKPSGANFSSVDFPFIILSGTPRSGQTSLYVDFSVSLSGVVNPYTLYWDFGNGIRYYSNTLEQSIQYSMPGNYIPFVRIEDANNIFVIDTLRVGYNR